MVHDVCVMFGMVRIPNTPPINSWWRLFSFIIFLFIWAFGVNIHRREKPTNYQWCHRKQTTHLKEEENKKEKKPLVRVLYAEW